MLVKSLAALSLAAQASALSVGLYLDSACTQGAGMSAFNNTCTGGNFNDNFAIGTTACSGTGSAVTAKVDLFTGSWTYEPYVAPTCTGTKLKSFTATATCASLGNLNVGGTSVPIYTKIDTAVDGSCGSAATAGTMVLYNEPACKAANFTGVAFPVAVDGVCRTFASGSLSQKVRAGHEGGRRG
jgi:hypothetical protein